MFTQYDALRVRGTSGQADSCILKFNLRKEISAGAVDQNRDGNKTMGKTKTVQGEGLEAVNGRLQKLEITQTTLKHGVAEDSLCPNLQFYTAGLQPARL